MGLDRLDFCEQNTKVTDIVFLMRAGTQTIRVFFAASLALLAATFTSAGEPVPASVTIEKAPLGVIKGVVRDTGGSPIAEASVAIFHSGTTKLLKQVVSGRDGSFLARIVPGKYTVLAVAYGFNPSYIFGVDVGRSAEITYGFKLERAGSGNTLPEKRLDKNSSKWRIRAAQMQRAIYQHRDGESEITAAVPDDDTAAAENRLSARRGQTVVETYFAGVRGEPGAGVNFASLIPVGEKADLIVAGQAGTSKWMPQRAEVSLKFEPFEDHKLRLSASVAKFGSVRTENEMQPLGQVSFQALDEWRIREGVIVIYGLDYSRFFGAGNDSSVSPRVGFQYDLNSKTRLRSGFATQIEERSWANALDLEGQSVAFAEPVSIDDLLTDDAGRPMMNRSSRLEFGIERVIDRSSTVEANIFSDTTIGRGVGLNNISFDSLDGDSFGAIVANQQGRTHGLRVVYNRRINSVFSTSAGYSFGQGQRLSPGALTDPGGVFESDFFHTFFTQVAADIGSKTSVRAIYRLSPRATVFAIDPFKGRLAIYDPGLSVFLTHALPNLGLPFRAQAVVDARNLFDTQANITNEDGALMLNAHRRILRGGIQFRF